MRKSLLVASIAVAALSLAGSNVHEATAEPPRAPPPNIPPPAPPSPNAGRYVAIDFALPAAPPVHLMARTNGVWTTRISGRVQVAVRGSAREAERITHSYASRTVTFVLPQARDEQAMMNQAEACFSSAQQESERLAVEGRLRDLSKALKFDFLSESKPPMRYLFEGLAVDDVKVSATDVEVRLNHPNLFTMACGQFFNAP